MALDESTQDALPVPELRIGSYRLIERLGSGGMSSVLRGVHDETGLEVAVKVLPRYLAKNPTLLQRFLREAKNAESLEHPNIIAIYDRGFDQGRYYLVLEYVSGGDLHDRVRRDGPLAVDQAVRIIRSACEGLSYAAGRGLIHRDIKPANLLMTPEGLLKITDLGLALQVEEEDERVTRDGTTVGTVDYMAPEQARDSRATSIRSDIYSLGCTFYYLLTGSPPFPGGVLVEKLKRHFTEPPPDVRSVRPEVSEALARLTQRMMAKKPEKRFQTYEELVAALDALSSAAPAQAGEPLYALVDDEDAEAQPVLPGPEPLFALIDEADEDPSTPAAAGRGADTFNLGAVDLAELAPLDREIGLVPEPAPVGPSAPSAPLTRSAGRGRAPVSERPMGIFDEHPQQEAYIPTPREASAKPWIVGGALVGLSFVVIVIGASWLMSFQQASSNDSADLPDEGAAVNPEVAINAPPIAQPRIVAPPPPQPQPATKQAAPPATGSSQPEQTTEPAAAPLPRNLPEPPVPPALEGQFVPALAKAPIPGRVDGPLVTVQRVTENPDDDHLNVLWRAFERTGGTVEIADDGPFFEDDFRIHRRDRLIRARPGLRPIIRVESPIQEYARSQPAVFVLEGSHVILDGLDLVVDVRDLPRNQTALFLCRGASLTLSSCTITILNPDGLPFSLVQCEGAGTGTSGAAGARPSQIRLEQTLVRSSALAGFELGGGSAEVVLSRSIFMSGKGAAFTVTDSSRSEPAGTRKIHLLRSLVATPGPVFRISGAASTGGAPAPVARAIASTFARIQTKDPAPCFIQAREELAGNSRDMFDWQGAGNTYAGWPGWLSAGIDNQVKLANLSAVKTAWADPEPGSQEQNRVWPSSSDLEWVVPAGLQRVVPERLPTLSRVAIPSPYLKEKTVGTFSRLEVAEAPASGELLELSFDVFAAPWRGDLGLFLRDKIPQGTRRVKIKVLGSGLHATSIVRPPEGTSLEIDVDQPEAGAPGAPLVWGARPGIAGDALFDLRGGDLTLNGVRLWRERGPLKHLVRVERGKLLLSQCWLQGSVSVEPGQGALLAYSVPLDWPDEDDLAHRPLCKLTDCLLMTGGDGVSAELERGVVHLENCAVACGGDAIVLLPRSPSNPEDAFLEADLWLDHSTIVAERSFVRLGPWPGPETGPRRPWLISTEATAFLAAFQRGRDAVLLRADTGALTHGAVFWQARGDAVDVNQFLASAQAKSLSNARPDVRQQWIDVWGSNHIVNVTGPLLSGAKQTVRLTSDPLRPGQFAPADLALNPQYHPGRNTLDVGADLRRIKIIPPGRTTSAPAAPGGPNGPRPRPGIQTSLPASTRTSP